jgi:hypothetical protein
MIWSAMSGILKNLLSISVEETTFLKRGFFAPRDSTRRQLEKVGEAFLNGYHLALSDQGIDHLTAGLSAMDLEFRGYGFEGAAMGLDLIDQLPPRRERYVDKFLRGPGKRHVYMVHVGIGWSMARWRFGISKRLARLDPLLRWLALDGFGFHEGYFRWSKYAAGARPPGAVPGGYGSRAFDQGLGRSLWFIAGADPKIVASAILGFHESRRADLWSGIGLAGTYAGGADVADLGALRSLAGQHWLHLAQGSVFAAGARYRADNMVPHTEVACHELCGIHARQAAELCDVTLPRVAEDTQTAYEMWRRSIRMHLRINEYFDQNFRLVPKGA